MNRTALVAGLLALAAPTLGAQSERQPVAKPRTETVWTVQISGISG